MLRSSSVDFHPQALESSLGALGYICRRDSRVIAAAAAAAAPALAVLGITAAFDVAVATAASPATYCCSFH